MTYLLVVIGAVGKMLYPESEWEGVIILGVLAHFMNWIIGRYTE